MTSKTFKPTHAELDRRLASLASAEIRCAFGLGHSAIWLDVELARQCLQVFACCRDESETGTALLAVVFLLTERAVANYRSDASWPLCTAFDFLRRYSCVIEAVETTSSLPKSCLCACVRHLGCDQQHDHQLVIIADGRLRERSGNGENGRWGALGQHRSRIGIGHS
jgi:hypothetical protein